MNLPKGSEVITTPFTFASTTHAIVRNGLEPIFCDINPVDFTIDVMKLEALITDKTSAIMPVHVYGNVCNIEEIQRIAKKYGLKVIYDAAHTFGVFYKNQGIGSFGDVSCFSFLMLQKCLTLSREELPVLATENLDWNYIALKTLGFVDLNG